MKKILMTLAAVLCCTMTIMAQATQMTQEEAVKYAEKMIKLADENPKNGKAQLKAGHALRDINMGDKQDLDSALSYYNKALKIAMEQPVPKDTLKGLAYYSIGSIYMGKGSMEDCFDYMELALDAYQEELGRFNPFTISSKLVCGSYMLGLQPQRAYPKIQEAFNDNMYAPQDKRVTNINDATILLEIALERLLFLQTEMFRYAVPMFFKDGKKYFVVQTKDWNIERPLVGWMLPSMMRTEEENDKFKGDPRIICDEDGNFSFLPDDEKPKMEFNFNITPDNPRKLAVKEGDARIWFFLPEIHKQLLEKFRVFKANNSGAQ